MDLNLNIKGNYIMDIDVNDRITLSDGNIYQVAGKVKYEGKIYYFLSDLKKITNIKCCYENSERHSVIEVNDKRFIQKLLPMFMDSQNEKYAEEVIETMAEENE